jgi:homogentisate 1,2-dioxygenase
VRHTGRFEKVDLGLIRTAPVREDGNVPLGQMRWSPTSIPKKKLTFVSGLHTMTTAGDAEARSGMAAHVLLVTKSMEREHFFDADGELLIVAQHGKLRFRTEFGVIEIEPGEICVIPRGVIFRVELMGGPARAYVCENYGGAFTLPERGPIGANCLANARDFLTPVAAYEDSEKSHTLYVKYGGELWRTKVKHSPLDVVAWHGNYYPYKYDLRRFSPVGALLFDHPILDLHGDHIAVRDARHRQHRSRDFPRALASGENTFRPPWYHRNIMSEFMGLVYGVYDAKPKASCPAA